MDYRPLGRTGIRVSSLCLGCMTFGETTDAAEAERIVRRFADAGGNFLDTANVYAHGKSEEILGRALAGMNRERIVLATKATMPMGEGINERGGNRKHLTFQAEESLRRLKTDYLDLFLVHCHDPRTPLEETLKALDGLVQAGKVRAIGASNYAAWHFAKGLGISDRLGLERFCCFQGRYSLISRGVELEILPLLREEGAAFTAWSPLQKGWLAGRTKDVEQPEGKRIGDWSEKLERYATDRSARVAARVAEVAARIGKTAAQVSLAWILAQPGVTGPVLGVRTLAQLEDNLGAVGWTLPAEEMKELNRASAYEIDYPYEFLFRRTPSLSAGK